MKANIKNNTLPEDFLTKRSNAMEIDQQYQKVSANTTVTSILETMPHPVMILNIYRQIVWGNSCLLAQLNIDDVDVLLGQRPGEVFDCVNATNAEHGCGTASECRICGASQAILQSLNQNGSQKECMILTTCNDAFNLQVKACAIDIDGELFDTVSLVDISDQKNKRILERLFFHDIMNLAGSLRGFVDVLTDCIQDDPDESNEILSILINGSDDLIELIKSQKDLLAAENNELAIYNKNINAAKLLVSVKELFARHFAFKNRSIIIHDIQSDIEFISDERILKRVIVNALKNALEAVNEGQTVTLRYQTLDDFVLFEIHNNSYMPLDVQGRIFRKSFSTKGQDRGIGTYSIKLFTEKYLHGKVWFESKESTGTTFYVQIPLQH